MITLMLSTRSVAGSFDKPLLFLESLLKKTEYPQYLQVIFRGDDDDMEFSQLALSIQKNRYPFEVKLLQGPRGRGYKDLHQFYEEAIFYFNPSVKIASVLAEDVTVKCKGWDRILLDCYEETTKKFGHDYFTVHQTLYPGLGSIEDCLLWPDPFLFYTKNWIAALGSMGLSSSIDAWVALTHHYLMKEYGILAKNFVPEVLFERQWNQQVDSIAAPRWVNARLENHDELRLPTMHKIIKQQAAILFAHIDMKKSNDHSISVYETVNHACDFFGSASILFRVFFNFVNQASGELLQKDMAILSEYIRILLILKICIPGCADDFKDVYHPLIAEIENLNKQFKTKFFSLSQ